VIETQRKALTSLKSRVPRRTDPPHLRYDGSWNCARIMGNPQVFGLFVGSVAINALLLTEAKIEVYG
jgi:hypothetical protein